MKLVDVSCPWGAESRAPGDERRRFLIAIGTYGNASSRSLAAFLGFVARCTTAGGAAVKAKSVDAKLDAVTEQLIRAVGIEFAFGTSYALVGGLIAADGVQLQAASRAVQRHAEAAGHVTAEADVDAETPGPRRTDFARFDPVAPQTVIAIGVADALILQPLGQIHQLEASAQRY